MAEKDELIGIIPINDRIPELESEVAYHLARATNPNSKEYCRVFPSVTKKYTH